MGKRVSTLLSAALAAERKPVFAALKKIFVPGGTDPELLGELAGILSEPGSQVDRVDRITKIRKGTDNLSDAETDSLTSEREDRLAKFENRQLADELRSEAVIDLLKAPSAARKAEILHAASPAPPPQPPPQRIAARSIPLVPYIVCPTGSGGADLIPVHAGMELVQERGESGKVRIALQTIEE